ncbi:hypothetical protein [Pseudomonas sp. MF6396]|uniref:hypothetical protein n=1 Tax=Pseudomonas sp. MF6396 TaxID=1960828 RepID=UPI00129077A9|nr:hypothetical protein [Pseudomonas sp. MF6396]
MIEVIEIVAELRAGNFANGTSRTAGRVVQVVGHHRFFVEVDHSVEGVDLPASAYGSVDQAKHAIVDYWRRCEQALDDMPNREWRKNPGILE